MTPQRPDSNRAAQGKVLMLAPYFPPLCGFGPVTRVAKLVRHLPAVSAWRPLVLTLEDRDDYLFLSRNSEQLLGQIPKEVLVTRCKTLEPRSARLAGRWEYAMAAQGDGSRAMGFASLLQSFFQDYVFIPDIHMLWLPFAVRAGRRIIERQNVDILFATLPPHSNALAAAYLQKATGLPLVLDFRDDWVGEPWPAMGTANSPAARRVQYKMERAVVRRAARVLTATPASLRAFRKRYPGQPEEKFVHLPNGYEPLPSPTEAVQSVQGRFHIVYGGSLGPGRDPESFLKALMLLKLSGTVDCGRILVSFAGGLPARNRAQVRKWGLEDMVKEVATMPPDRFNGFMAGADLLLAIADPQRPTSMAAKIYDYWGVGGPPVLLMAGNGAAKDFVEKNRLGYVVKPDDPVEAAALLHGLFEKRKQGPLPAVGAKGLARYAYPRLAAQLSGIFDEVIGGGDKNPDSESGPQPLGGKGLL